MLPSQARINKKSFWQEGHAGVNVNANYILIRYNSKQLPIMQGRSRSATCRVIAVVLREMDYISLTKADGARD